MSLNGLDSPEVVEAHQAALAEAGGWFLLKYTSRDSVDILTRGHGGAVEAKGAIAEYTELSPLFGFLLYRRRKVLIKYVPEGTSRLLQVRVTVHFAEFTAKFSPHDTTISVTTANGLSETGLAAACSLHTATASNSSSCASLQRKRLDEITEDAEESNDTKSTGPEILITEPPKTPTSNDARPQTPSNRPWTPRSSSLVKVDLPGWSLSTNPEDETPNEVTAATPDSEPEKASNGETTPKADETGVSRPGTAHEDQGRPQTGKSDAPSYMSTHTQSSFAPTFDGDARPSISAARPSLSDLSFASLYEFKPKVKLGPRPSTTDRCRNTNAEGKRVANLPAGLRAATRRAAAPSDTPEESRPYSRGQESIYSMKSAKSSRVALNTETDALPPPLPSPRDFNRTFASNRTSTSTVRPDTRKSAHGSGQRGTFQFPHAPPPIPDMPRSPVRPTSAASAKSVPISLGSNNRMTPEKQRLMRAVELRKRQQEQRKLRQEREEEERRQLAEAKSEGPGVDETQVDDADAEAKPLRIELEVSTGAGDEEEDNDQTPKAGSPQEENGQQHGQPTQEERDDSDLGQATEGAAQLQPSNSENLEKAAEREVPLTSNAGSRPAVDAPSPTSPLESKSSDQGEVESTRPSSVEDVHGLADETRKEPSVSAIGVNGDCDPSEEGTAPSQIIVEVTRPGTNDSDSAAQTERDGAGCSNTLSPVPADGDQLAAIQRKTSMRDRRKGGLQEPLRVDVSATTTDHSDLGDTDDDNLSDDDSFMDELRTAEVQEAKPMSVSKSPITPFFNRRPSNGSLLNAATVVMRNDDSSTGTPSTIRTGTPVRLVDRNPSFTTPEPISAFQIDRAGSNSSRAGSSTVTPKSDSKSFTKKINVSSGISQRIKALAESSNRDSVATLTPDRVSEDRLSRVSFASRRTSIRSLAWGNHDKDKESTKEPSQKQRPSRTIQMTFGESSEAPRESAHVKRLSRTSLSSMAPSENHYSTSASNPANSILSPAITAARDNAASPYPQATYSISHPARHDSQKRSRDSVSVTARIIRANPDGTWGPDRTVPTPNDSKPLDLQQSPLIIEHHRTEPFGERTLETHSNRNSVIYAGSAATTNGAPSALSQQDATAQAHLVSPGMSRSSTESGVGSVATKESSWNLRARMTRRMSEARSGSVSSAIVPANANASSSMSLHHRSMSTVSVDSLAYGMTDDDGMSITSGKEGKRGRRTSRLFKRMSSSISASARKGMSAISHTSMREEGEAYHEVIMERQRPDRCDVGEMNVQFPDTLLWKRRYLHISPSGDLVIQLARSDAPSSSAATAAATKRFHLTEFRAPHIPDADAQELPNSVVLDFVDGRTLQVACESPVDQRRALAVLRGKREEWLEFGAGT